MPEVKETITQEILKYKPVKYLIVILLSFLTLFLAYSFFYHLYRCHKDLNSQFLWGAMECTECKQITVDSIVRYDTVYKERIVYVPQITKATKTLPPISQKIDSGGSGIQNNAPNFGDQAGRDLYKSEPTITQEQLEVISKEIDAEITKTGISNITIRLGLTDAASPKIFERIGQYLVSKKYNVIGGAKIMGSFLKGTRVLYKEDKFVPLPSDIKEGKVERTDKYLVVTVGMY